LPFLIDQVKTAVNLLAAANQGQLWQSVAAEPSRQASRHRPLWLHPWFLNGVQGVLALMLLSSLWGETAFSSLVLLITLFATEALRRWPEKFMRITLLAAHKEAVDLPPSIKIHITVIDFLNALADNLLTADKLLIEINSLGNNEPRYSHLEDYGSVLNLLQDLLEAYATNDAPYALRKAKTVPAVLQQYQIQIQEFNGNNAHFFEFLPSLNPDDSEIKMLTPALVKQDRLLTRGRVTEPSDLSNRT
jgi:hypothetical protein